ncbi:Uncharacterized protein HZ326_25525, partial [Fusarium oxysporum f. sp. albedinis]
MKLSDNSPRKNVSQPFVTVPAFCAQLSLLSWPSPGSSQRVQWDAISLNTGRVSFLAASFLGSLPCVYQLSYASWDYIDWMS